MTYIQINPLYSASYDAITENDCHTEDEKEAFRKAMNSGYVVYNHVLAIRMSN